jgi:hypothetical protein
MARIREKPGVRSALWEFGEWRMAVSPQEFQAFCGPALERAKRRNVVDGSLYVNPDAFAVRL